MKAIALDAFGGPEVLRKRGLPRPEPKDDQLRVRVVVAGVTMLDVAVRRGAMDTESVRLPWVPGFEVAGVVDALGPLCSRFRLGDRVWALLPRGGGYAEYAVAHEGSVAPMPASLLFEEAAALALDGVAVWNALFDGPAPEGAVVLGASGGAGHLAVQLALAVGARVVVQAPPTHREFVDRLGGVEWADERATAADLAAGLGEHPRILDCGSGAETVSAPPQIIDLRGARGSMQDIVRARDPLSALSGLSTMVEQRRLRPRLFKILKIGQAKEAHEAVESTDFCGKLSLAF